MLRTLCIYSVPIVVAHYGSCTTGSRDIHELVMGVVFGDKFLIRTARTVW